MLARSARTFAPVDAVVLLLCLRWQTRLRTVVKSQLFLKVRFASILQRIFRLDS
jgi:hypothetical protein